MPDYGRFRSILAEQQEGVLILTLNRPDRLNAIGDDMHEGLEAILADLRRDTCVRAVCSGAPGAPSASVGMSKPLPTRHK